MKLWCTSTKRSKQSRGFRTTTAKSNDSVSSFGSYATISSISIRKSDSGFSDTTSSIQIPSCVEQIFAVEQTYHETLRKYIIKYSRPLRRVLNPTEIVDLFQNIEKISAISQSIVRHCEKLVAQDNIVKIPISTVYQSWFDIMIDSYNTYISRSVNIRCTVEKYCEKIAYFLQIPIDIVRQEITEFIILPIRHICMLNDLFDLLMNDYSDTIGNMDWYLIQHIGSLYERGKTILQVLHDDLMSRPNSLIYEPRKLIALQRVNNEPWQRKQIEVRNSKLTFVESDGTTSICLSNVVHIEENVACTELCLIAASTESSFSKCSSIQMVRVFIRFDDIDRYLMWSCDLKRAVQLAKDRNWCENNELVI